MFLLLCFISCDKPQIEPIINEPIVTNKQAICKITYPINGEIFPEGQQMKIACIAFDIDSNFKQLDLKVDGTFIKTYNQFPENFGKHNKTVNSVPFAFIYNTSGLKPGTHSVTLQIIDSVGYYQDSIEINIIERATPENVIDFDGNEYSTVKIGNQIWLASNLRTTHLNNGTPIKEVKLNNDWSKNKQPAYCWYNIDSTKPGWSYDYGAQYNYACVETKNICPKGWRVPSRTDWLSLVEEIDKQMGPFNIDLKDYRWPDIDKFLKTKSDWGDRPNNHYGFSLKANPIRYWDGSYIKPTATQLWSDTRVYNEENVYCYHVGYGEHYLNRYIYSPTSGMSIRCMKNVE